MKLEPGIPAIEWSQTNALDCTDTGIGIPCVRCAYYKQVCYTSEVLCKFILPYFGLMLTKGHGAELPALFYFLIIYSLSAHI